jgi:hypothetical protein
MTARLLLGCRRGASAAEFAMVLPLLLLLIFGIIDGGRFVWEMNRAQKATQYGARFAAVTDMVPARLASYSFATDSEVPAVPPGSAVPRTSFTSVSCTSSGCAVGDPADDCKIGETPVGPNPGFDPEALSRIARRMRVIYPVIEDSNVRVTYCNVGLGFAGDPYGPDVAPQIIISLTGLDFVPLTSLLLATIPLPASSGSMTLEDGIGNVSN